MENAVKAIKRLIESEIGEYGGSFKIDEESIDDSGGYVYLSSDISVCQKENTIDFKAEINKDEPDIEMLNVFIDMGDGNWEEVRTCDWRVKYFWMKLFE
jgi:hypothetical protein